MKLNYSQYLVLICFVFCLFSCKKEGCMDKTALNYNPSATKDNGSCKDYVGKIAPFDYYRPFLSDTCATLYLITEDYGKDYINSQYLVRENYRFSSIFTIDKGSSYLSAGDTYVKALKKPYNPSFDYKMNYSTNNIYTMNGTAGVIPQTILLEDSVYWWASGDIWPSFSLATSIKKPFITSVDYGSPSIKEDYVISGKTPLNNIPDSILVEIKGQKGNLIKTIDGQTPSFSIFFSENELKSVGYGPANIRVIALNYYSQSINNRLYYIIREYQDKKEVFINL